MPRKKKTAKAKKKVESLKHRDKRKNIPTEELRDFVAEDEEAPPVVLYPRDPSLDPQLVWKGKDELDSQDLAVPAVPIYIQEEIRRRAIIEDLGKESKAGRDRQVSPFDDSNGIEFDQRALHRREPEPPPHHQRRGEARDGRGGPRRLEGPGVGSEPVRPHRNREHARLRHQQSHPRRAFAVQRPGPHAGTWTHAAGEYTEEDGKTQRVAVRIGPEHGTVGPQIIKGAAKEAVRGIGSNVLVAARCRLRPSGGA